MEKVRSEIILSLSQDQSLGETREREMKTRLQLEEAQSRLDELTGQAKDAEKSRKQLGAELERKDAEIRNQKSQLRETEQQLKREQDTAIRLKKAKQERDTVIVDMEDATQEQVSEMRRQIEDRQKEVFCA